MAERTSKLKATAQRRQKSCAEREYGVTPKELAAFAKRMNAQHKKYKEAGLLVTFTGDIDALLTQKPQNKGGTMERTDGCRAEE